VFDGKGYIFFSSGERGQKENAQDLSNHLGKILRLHEDGRVPKDNPFVKRPELNPKSGPTAIAIRKDYITIGTPIHFGNMNMDPKVAMN
jgi:hypothetical protein